MNYCYNCNNWVDDNSGCCPFCGGQTTPVQDPRPISYQQPVAEQKSFNQYIEQLGSDILKWGIMSVAFACSFIASFMGIIFAVKANKKVAEYIHYMGGVSGKAKVGKHLAKGGLIGGIAMTAFFVLYVLFLIFYAIIIAVLVSQGF